VVLLASVEYCVVVCANNSCANKTITPSKISLFPFNNMLQSNKNVGKRKDVTPQ